MKNQKHMDYIQIRDETQEEPDQCQTCEEALNVKHILIYCRKYTDIKTKLNLPEHFQGSKTALTKSHNS